MIGKKGATVQRINNESGAMCRVVNDVDPQVNLQGVTFSGNEAQVTRAFALFMETLEGYDTTAGADAVAQLTTDWAGVHGEDRGPRPVAREPQGPGAHARTLTA